MPKILIIDDDFATRTALSALLKRRHFDVFLAPDGPTGLQLVSSVDFDAVIIDMFMPGMDGIATIRELIKLKPYLPFIAMSGYAFTDRKQGAPDFLGMATRLGAAAALQKPFDTHDLLEAVDRSLAQRRSPLIELNQLAPEEMREQLPAPTFFGQTS
jgi:two-component system, response regulator, stage 0 sporulation protein F